MKRISLFALLLIVFCSGAVVRRAVAAADDANAVWAGEEAYWRYVQAHDNEGYRTLWAEDFVGWPISMDHPAHKADINLASRANVVSYELHRESVDMHGPVGITFYRATVHRRNADGSESASVSRLTHTWMKQGNA